MNEPLYVTVIFLTLLHSTIHTTVIRTNFLVSSCIKKYILDTMLEKSKFQLESNIYIKWTLKYDTQVGFFPTF